MVDHSIRAPDQSCPQGFRWRLTGDELPPLTAALRVGDATRGAIYRGADARGLLPLPNSFHRGSDRDHSHAFWLAEDADEDGLIDHVLLFAAAGLPGPLIPVLAEGGNIRLADLGEWPLVPDWMGRRAPGALFGPARSWVTATAYVTAASLDNPRGRRQRKSFGPRAQLQWEIRRRRLGAKLADLAITPSIVRRGVIIRAQDFSLKVRNRSPLPDAMSVGAQICFDQSVWGPLAFGFGAHFGLGLFEPADALGITDDDRWTMDEFNL
jgi:CRISPR-associated protein Csb2